MVEQFIKGTKKQQYTNKASLQEDKWRNSIQLFLNIIVVRTRWGADFTPRRFHPWN